MRCCGVCLPVGGVSHPAPDVVNCSSSLVVENAGSALIQFLPVDTGLTNCSHPGLLPQAKATCDIHFLLTQADIERDKMVDASMTGNTTETDAAVYTGSARFEAQQQRAMAFTMSQVTGLTLNGKGEARPCHTLTVGTIFVITGFSLCAALTQLLWHYVVPRN